MAVGAGALLCFSFQSAVTFRAASGAGGVLTAASKSRDLSEQRYRGSAVLSAKHGFAPPSGCTWMYTLGLLGAGLRRAMDEQSARRSSGVRRRVRGAGRTPPALALPSHRRLFSYSS